MLEVAKTLFLALLEIVAPDPTPLAESLVFKGVVDSLCGNHVQEP